MTSALLDPREFAPRIRKTMYRGKTAWEVDIRGWPEVAEAIMAPQRKRFSDHEQARSYYRRLIVAAAAGAPVDPIRLPVRLFFDRFQRWIEKKSPSSNTHASYRGATRLLLAHLETVRISDVSGVSPAVLQGFIEAETGRLAPTTLQTTMTVVSSAFSWGVRAGMIDSNPATGMIPRAKAPERRALTAAERNTIMGDDGPHSDYWRLYLLTGMRRNELLELTLDRVHLDTPAPFLSSSARG